MEDRLQQLMEVPQDIFGDCLEYELQSGHVSYQVSSLDRDSITFRVWESFGGAHTCAARDTHLDTISLPSVEKDSSIWTETGGGSVWYPHPLSDNNEEDITDVDDLEKVIRLPKHVWIYETVLFSNPIETVKEFKQEINHSEISVKCSWSMIFEV